MTPEEKTDWHSMETAPLFRTVLLKCSDGQERIGRHEKGALWGIEDQPGVYVLDAFLKSPDAVGMIEATHWK